MLIRFRGVCWDPEKGGGQYLLRWGFCEAPFFFLKQTAETPTEPCTHAHVGELSEKTPRMSSMLHVWGSQQKHQRCEVLKLMSCETIAKVSK